MYCTYDRESALLRGDARPSEGRLGHRVSSDVAANPLHQRLERYYSHLGHRSSVVSEHPDSPHVRVYSFFFDILE